MEIRLRDEATGRVDAEAVGCRRQRRQGALEPRGSDRLGEIPRGNRSGEGYDQAGEIAAYSVEGPGVGLCSGPNSTDEYRVSRCLGAKLLDVAVWDAFVAEWPAGPTVLGDSWRAVRAKVGCTLASVAQSPRLLFLAATAL